MKNRKRLERKTPLRNRKPMKRGTAKLSAVTPLSSKRKYDPTEEPCKVVVKKRSGGICEICGIRPGQSVHHRLKQSQQGPWTPGNCMHLCGDGRGPDGCHGMVSNTRAEYYEKGWLVSPGAWLPSSPVDPPWLEKPLLYRGRLVLLDEVGGVLESFDFGAAA
jgi:hypothetical protein